MNELMRSGDPEWLAGPGMAERMHVHRRATGLRPLGRHRRLLDWVAREVCLRCADCNGVGYRTREVMGVWTWTWCRACRGYGRVISARQRALLRRWVGRAFPEAVPGVRARRGA